jgi:hypothetical protein
MPTWSCYGHVTGSKYLGNVEADTEEDARNKAWKLDTAYVSVCNHCSSQVEDPEIDDITVESGDDAICTDKEKP